MPGMSSPEFSLPALFKKAQKQVHAFILILVLAPVPLFGQTGEPYTSVYNYTTGTIGFIFSTGSDGTVRYVRQTAGNSAFLRKGTIRSPRRQLTFVQLTSGISSEGYHFLFGLTNDGRIYTSYLTEEMEWSEWNVNNWELFYPIPIFRQIKCVRNNGLGLTVAGLDVSGALYSCVQEYYYSGKNQEGPPRPRNQVKWMKWQKLEAKDVDQLVMTTYGPYSGTDAVVFARNKQDGSVSFTAQKSYSWRPWVSLQGSELKGIEVQKNTDGRIGLFAIGGDGRLYERHETAPGGSWSDWTTLNGNGIVQLSCQVSVSGRAAVFALHADGSVDHTWQTEPGGNNWSDWVTLFGSQLRSISTGKTSDGRLLVTAIGGDGKVYYRIQTAAEMGWENWQTINF